MKKIIYFLLFNKRMAKVLIRPILSLHSMIYRLATILSIVNNNGVHPKHFIMKYKEWFVSHIRSDWVVLDIGSHSGLLSESISKKSSFVYGIEINKEYFNEASNNIKRKNIRFILSDATSFNYESIKKIDCVVLSNVLEHIEYRVSFLRKLVKNIKFNDKKRILIRVPMIDREWLAIYKKNMGMEYRLDKTHFTEYTFDQFKAELTEANINILSHTIKFGEIYAVCESV